MLKKWFRSFAFRRIAKFENVSERHRITFVRMLSDFSLTRERQKTAGGERRANAECVCVANFIFRNHPANLLAGESAAIKNGFAFLPLRTFRAGLNWPRQKEITTLIRETRRRKKIA